MTRKPETTEGHWTESYAIVQTLFQVQQGRVPAISPAILIFIMSSVFLVACGVDTVSTTVDNNDAANSKDYQVDDETPIWRYVNSGWVTPINETYADAFSRELRVAIITSDAEMQRFNREVIAKRTNGTGATLGRPKYPESVVLVAYLLWLPVQGDPLSVVGIDIEANRVVVDLELDEDAQGRELPYLYAPMSMVMVDRSELPLNGLVDFEFMLDGDLMATASVTLGEVNHSEKP